MVILKKKNRDHKKDSSNMKILVDSIAFKIPIWLHIIAFAN